MYLSTFRKHGVGPGNWGTTVWWGHMADTADILLDEVDDTLNGWKEAHEVFNTRQQEQPKVDGHAFTLMKPMVHKVIRDRLHNMANSYPVEALTYALLERWISVRQADWSHSVSTEAVMQRIQRGASELAAAIEIKYGA